MKRFFKILFLFLGIFLLVAGGYFFLVKKLDRDAVEQQDFYTRTAPAIVPVLIPTKFIDGARFYIKIPTAKGELMAYGDSGGGLSMILPVTVEKFGLKDKVKTGFIAGLMPVGYIPFDDLTTNKDIPGPIPFTKMIVRHMISRVDEPYILIPPMEPEVVEVTKVMDFDAFLGQNFFMQCAWTIDYPKQQIWVNTPISDNEVNNPNVQRVGFKKNSKGTKIYGHASMKVTVDGEVIDMLFDTGATIVLSEKGKEMLGTANKTTEGSFIAASVFDRWRKNHPEWKYYEKMEKNADGIEVPMVKIGTYEVGPVLFARRPDEAWSEGMIQSMDKVVKGAIGGSALKYFKVMIDYNAELLKVEDSSI